MLTKMHIVIAGGDTRQLEVVRRLSELNARISLIGFDHLDEGFVGVSKQSFDTIDPRTVDAIIFPVSGVSDDGMIDTTFTNTQPIITKKWLEKTPNHFVIYSGISSPYLLQASKETNRAFLAYIENDEVAIYNSIPTAEGTVMIVIQHTDKTIHGSHVIITGLGRVGMTLSRVFKSLGAYVEIAANEPELRARASEMQMKSYPLQNLKDQAYNADVVINTIPAMVIDSHVLNKLPPHALVVDIASNPGGTDFSYAKKRGINALHVLGLPSKVAPKTAGQIIAKALEKLLYEQLGKIKGGNE